jgi:hypothetical protein
MSFDSYFAVAQNNNFHLLAMTDLFMEKNGC